ncbi:MAG: hypothetical protein ACHWZW_03200 [Spirulina sp.]
MDTQALQAMQEKLLRQQQTLRSQSPLEIRSDWPVPHHIGVHSTAARVAETVDMLQRRSWQSGATGATPRSRSEVARRVGVDRPRRFTPATYQRQMAAIVKRINDLSREQEQAMAEMQWVQQQLVSFGAEGSSPPAWPTINFDQAVTARASLDASGQVLLGYGSVRPQPVQEEEAHALAQHLRQAYGSPQGQRPGSVGLRRVWRRLGAWITKAIPSRAIHPHQDRIPSPAPSTTEAMLWAGAGVGGRFVIQGLMMTIPSLGIVAVVACLASLSLTLYRAILSPTPDVNLMSRIALALAGLLIGGYLV